jgi:hypothetical protein
MCQCKGTSREKLKNRSSSAPATSAPSSSPAPVALHRKSRRSTQKEVDYAGPSEHQGLVYSSEDESGPPPATPNQNVQGQLGNEPPLQTPLSGAAKRGKKKRRKIYAPEAYRDAIIVSPRTHTYTHLDCLFSAHTCTHTGPICSACWRKG